MLGNRAGEIDRHNNELLTHGNKVKELEAELAAAKERANKHHHHLMGLKCAPAVLIASQHLRCVCSCKSTSVLKLGTTCAHPVEDTYECLTVSTVLRALMDVPHRSTVIRGRLRDSR